jgi:hypothetical protein
MTATTTAAKSTHERYIHAVRDAVVAWALAEGTITDEQATRMLHAKLLYGIGDGSYRGICHYSAWENGIGKVDVVEIAASAQESFVQLAGTTLHELGHVLTGWGEGHGNGWKDGCVALGFKVRPNAAGQVYRLAMFAPKLREIVYRLAAEIGDGSPAFRTYGLGGLAGLFAGVTLKPCSAGVGTRGGKSRGTGSGSRLRLWECECERPVKVRVASDDFRAHCDECGESFKRK